MDIISPPKTKHVVDVEVGLLSGDIHSVTLQQGDTVERSGPELIIMLRNPDKRLYYLLTPGMWYSEQQRTITLLDQKPEVAKGFIGEVTHAGGGAAPREETRSLRVG